MPEGDVFHRRHRIGAHHAGEPGEIFRQHRVALVRHCRRALLALGKEFLGFQHLGALQMADFDRQPLDGRGDHAERCKIHRVAVARDHLGRDRLGHQPHRLGDMFLHARIDLRKGADRARDGAGGDFLAGGDQALAGAGKFRIGIGKLEPERHRLGVDAVGAPDGRGHLVLEGTLFQRRQNLVDISDQQVRGAGELHVEAGVEHVGRGHALVDEACLGADDFGQMSQEGDDVVLGLALDLVDPRHVEGGIPGLAPDRLRGLLRDDAKFRLRISRMRFDVEPDLEASLGLPDGGHFRAGIAGDHRKLRTSRAGCEAVPADLFLRCALANRVRGGHPYGGAETGKPTCSGRAETRSGRGRPGRL